MTETSSTPKPVYAIPGKNMAPLRPLEEMRQQKPIYNPDQLTEALQKKYLDYKERDQQSYIENCNVGMRVANLRTGKMVLLRNAMDGRYMFVKREGRFSDNKTIGGQFQFYSTKLTAEWLSSRPERDPICPSDDDQVEEFISGVKIIQDYYDRKFFDSRYEEQESLSAQDYGTWITRYRFDPDVQDIVRELLDFPACRWDIRFRAEESPYFIYESKCSTAVLEHQLDAEIASGNDEENYGLQRIESLARTGGNVAGDGKDRAWGNYNKVENENIVTEMWLQPSEYVDIALDMPEKTVAGRSLPAGNSLLEIFPKGLCAVGINGMQRLIGLYAEDSKDHIVSGLYHVQSFSGVGKGISDAVDVMKDMNDLHSQILAHIKAHSTPGFGYNSAVVSEQDSRKIGQPRTNIPIDFTNAPDGARTINDVVQAITPGNPANGAFEYLDKMNNNLQMSMQVTDFSNGLPGVDNKTATGAKIGDANSEMVLVPQHLNKADHRKRSDKVIYNLFKRYIDKPRFFATKDKNGITMGKYLSGTQFADVDIDFEIVANSEVPMTPYAQRDAQTQLYQQTGGALGFAQLKQMDPEYAGELAAAFGVKLTIPTQHDIARVCRKRIEQAKKMLQEELDLQQMMSAATGIPHDNSGLAAAIVSRVVPRISPKEPYYTQKVAWLAEFLDTDEMQYTTPEMRDIIEEMIDVHMQESTLGQAQVQYDQNIGTIVSNLPMLVGENAMNQQNQGIAQQYQIQQRQQQNIQGAAQTLAAETTKAGIADKASEADHQRQLALNEQTHRHNIELKQMEPERAAA